MRSKGTLKRCEPINEFLRGRATLEIFRKQDAPKPLLTLRNILAYNTIICRYIKEPITIKNQGQAIINLGGFMYLITPDNKHKFPVQRNEIIQLETTDETTLMADADPNYWLIELLR